MERHGRIRPLVTLLLHSLVVQCQDVSVVQRAVDIVLPCQYVLLKDGGRGSMGGLSFSRDSILLVLRNITVNGGEELDPITEYEAPKDTKTITYQATVNVGPIPFGERLLHAECEDEEVSCELSPLYAEFYIAHIYLPELSVSMLCEAVMFTGEADLPESSKSLTLLTVNLVLSSSRPMHQSQISEDVTLNCEVWGVHDGMEVEWYFQKEGRGKKLFPGEESHISMEQGVEKSGDLSLTVRGVRVQDEGTYICSVKAERHKIQQILQLQIRQPPKVTVIQNASPTIDLICRTDRYFPLDVKIDWLLNGVPIPNPDLESSSHRRNSDGTYNLTNILKVPAPAGETVPDIYTCSVSHVSVEEPILMNISITSPDVKSSKHTACNMVNLFIVTSVPFTFVLVIIIWIKIHKTRREEKKMV